jgi:hypothetical protein
MFRKLLGRKDKKLKHKKRLSPSAATPEGMAQSHPMYQYALNEFAQTVGPGTTNDDGKSVVSLHQEDGDEEDQTSRVEEPQISPSIDQPLSTDSSGIANSEMGTQKSNMSEHHSFPPLSPTGEGSSMFARATSLQQARSNTGMQQRYPLNEPTMPDATYEETYGDAYIGGPIRYVYPSGYQSMRPRGGPWKLSIFICVAFTWLSVFIIGHCSDQVDQSLYDQTEIDDDTLVMETRWCGSRLLYLMWVISMTITGLATAYCSVIGYIKVRDFAVANVRSQPPGMVGKSDYYIKIGDHGGEAAFHPHYKKTIYQADGNPQFWGGHIYRPTQAAVAITSR